MNLKFIVLFIIILFAKNTIAQIPEMVEVKGGTFILGEKNNDFNIAHAVTLSNFSISKYEISVAEYKFFCNSSGRKFPVKSVGVWQDNHPMALITYDDAISYCSWLSKMVHHTFRLPTEAEWEYAARGGNKSKGYIYSGGNNATEVGWGSTNAEGQTHTRGTQKSNELGIFDMTGNVWEWCQDFWGRYPSFSQLNPNGSLNSPYKVVRGGSWFNSEENMLTSTRSNELPAAKRGDLGFRIVSQND